MQTFMVKSDHRGKWEVQQGPPRGVGRRSKKRASAHMCVCSIAIGYFAS